MAQGFVLPLPKARFFTADGAPAAGYLLHFFVSGTTTPQDTYSDSGLTTPNTNPVVLDPQGEATIFLPAGTVYTVALHDAADTLVWSEDGIVATIPPEAGPGAPAPVPTGGIIAYGAATAPTGFLVCDGSAVSRGTFAALFAVIDIAFGAGDGTTTFNLPDLRQRFPLGTADSGTGSVLGGVGGTIDHTHTGPSHTHDVTVTEDGWGSTLNNPSFTGRLNVGNASGTGNLTGSYQPTGDKTFTSAAGGTGATGTANPPFCSVVFLIKT